MCVIQAQCLTEAFPRTKIRTPVVMLFANLEKVGVKYASRYSTTLLNCTAFSSDCCRHCGPLGRGENEHGKDRMLLANSHVRKSAPVKNKRRVTFLSLPCAIHRRRLMINGTPIMYLQHAPMSSKGRVVPRPSLRTVPSTIPVPGYTNAVDGVGIFGLGITHGNPVSANSMERCHPCESKTQYSGKRVG